MEHLKIGNTNIYIVPPEITEEERKERLDQIIALIQRLWINKVMREEAASRID